MMYVEQSKHFGIIAIMAIIFFSCFLRTPIAEAFTIESYEERIEDRFIVSPANLEANLSPGETTTLKMTVVNRLGREAVFFLGKEDFTGSQDPDNAVIFLGEATAPEGSARSWVEPEINEFTLKQGERIILDLKVTAPAEVSPGGHYAAVFIGTRGETETGEEQVRLLSRIGLLIFITTPGDIQEEGRIDEFSSPQKFYRTGPVEFRTIFNNQGNVHVRPSGKVVISNLLGAVVAEIPLQEWTVLPRARRAQEASWERKWILGKYRARLELYYGFGQAKQLSQELVFYAFPWHLAVILLVVTAVTVWLFRWIGTKYEIKRKED